MCITEYLKVDTIISALIFVCVPECRPYEARVAILRQLGLALSNSHAKLSSLSIAVLPLWVKDLVMS